MTDLFGIVALLGMIATVVGAVALIRGRLPSLGIKDRKAAGILTAIGFSWFIFGGMLLPAEEPNPTTQAEEKLVQAEVPEQVAVDLRLNPGPHNVVDADAFNLSGSTEPGATVEASWSNGHVTAVADPSGAFNVQIAPLTEIGETLVDVTAYGQGKKSTKGSATINRTMSEANYKARAITIPYDELNKDPDSRKGTIVTYRGEVFQYDSRTSTSSMIVSVTNQGYGFWSDEMFLVLEPALGQNADEDDLIQFWGTVTGSFTYDTAIGGSNTLPAVNVEYLTVTSKR